MAERFNYEEHKKRIRERLNPPANIVGRLLQARRRIRLPQRPRVR
ncbi:hypothetical protein LCGC14_0890580 [marine sediment metagenome]|uniref:Uncharacterized protein n=1 Tax=marine sediment metagenome TaxID=412755 RepID=A0A0F9RIP2_9ZZZZ